MPYIPLCCLQRYLNHCHNTTPPRSVWLSPCEVDFGTGVEHDDPTQEIDEGFEVMSSSVLYRLIIDGAEKLNGHEGKCTLIEHVRFYVPKFFFGQLHSLYDLRVQLCGLIHPP
jgi:hypothetical protein